MQLRNEKVAIIGGGPAGLMLGRLLQGQGVDIKIYERDKDKYARWQGSALDMHHDTGLKAITAAGLLENFKKLYRPGADKSVVVDSRMRVIKDDHLATGKELTFGDELFRPEIDRGPLRDMLVSSIKEENIVWDARFTALKPSGTGWNIYFEDAPSAYADLVIAADGANSKLRKYLTDITPVYSGVTSIEGNIYRADINAPKIWGLAKGGSLFALENGKTISFITKGDGTLTFLIGLERPEDWLAVSGIDLGNKQSVEAWFKEEFADWNSGWHELFSTDEVSFLPRVWYHFPQDQHWISQSNLTMIGDAAHRIPPYAGEGANQALADALDLYETLCCEDFNTITEAISSFEHKMLLRSAAITDETLKNTYGFHQGNNLQFLLNLFGVEAGDH